MSLIINGSEIYTTNALTVNGTKVKRVEVNGKLVWGFTGGSDFKLHVNPHTGHVYYGKWSPSANHTRIFWDGNEIGYLSDRHPKTEHPYELYGHLYALEKTNTVDLYAIAKLG